MTVVHYSTRVSTQNKSSQKRDLRKAPKQKQYASMEIQAGESQLHRRKTRQGNASRRKKKESEVDFRKELVVVNIGDNIAKEDSIKESQGNKDNKRNSSRIHSSLESELDTRTGTSSNIKEQSALRINDSRLTKKTNLNCSTRVTRSMRGSDKSQNLSVFVHNVEQTILKENNKNNSTFIELFPDKKNAPKRAEKVLSKTMPTVANASVENTAKLSTSQHNKTTGMFCILLTKGENYPCKKFLFLTNYKVCQSVFHPDLHIEDKMKYIPFSGFKKKKPRRRVCMQSNYLYLYFYLFPY